MNQTLDVRHVLVLVFLCSFRPKDRSSSARYELDNTRTIKSTKSIWFLISITVYRVGIIKHLEIIALFRPSSSYNRQNEQRLQKKDCRSPGVMDIFLVRQLGVNNWTFLTSVTFSSS